MFHKSLSLLVILLGILLVSGCTSAGTDDETTGSGPALVVGDGSAEGGLAEEPRELLDTATNFDKSLGEGYSHEVVQTADGGYAILGTKFGSYNSKDGAVLVKTDVAGNVEWEKIYASEKEAGGYALVQTSDKGYLFIGTFYSPGINTGTDILLVKTDANGNEEWEKTFGKIKQDDFGSDVLQASDGNYVLVGSARLGLDPWIIKTDTSGDIIWDNKFEYAGSPAVKGTLHSVVEVADGGYVAVGEASNDAWSSYSSWIVKVDKDGEMVWEGSVPSVPEPMSIARTSDGGYIVTGKSSSGDSNVALVKLDSTGTKEWSKTFDNGGGERGEAVIQTSEGGYMIATSEFDRGGLWLIKTDSAGAMEWDKTVKGKLGYYAKHSVIQTTDGGYAVAVSVDDDLRLMKTDENGEI